MPSATSPTTETRLLDTAAQLFASKGYNAVGIRQIAGEAGLTIGALYHYADSKEALFLRVLRRGYQAVTTDAAAAAASGTTSTQRLRNLINAHVQGEVAERELWRLTRAELGSLSPDGRAEMIELRDQYEAVWAHVIETGTTDGTFHPIDASLARLSLVMMCSGVADWYRPDGRLTLDQIADTLTAQALLLLRATVAVPGR